MDTFLITEQSLNPMSLDPQAISVRDGVSYLLSSAC